MATFVHLAHHHHTSVVIRAQDKYKWLGIVKPAHACPKGYIVWKAVHGSPGRLDLHIQNAGGLPQELPQKEKLMERSNDDCGRHTLAYAGSEDTGEYP